MASLQDPRNPRSPFNRFNYDSPWSITNPISPHYNPRAVADTGVLYVLAGMVLVVVGLPFLLVRGVVRSLGVGTTVDGGWVLSLGFWVVLTLAQIFLVFAAGAIAVGGNPGYLVDWRVLAFVGTLVLNPVFFYHAVLSPRGG